MNYLKCLALSTILFLCACRPNMSENIPAVEALVETEAVIADKHADAADDPALWIHPEDVNKSLIIGSNKTYGIEVFGLDGKKLDTYKVGRVNNIDVRTGFPLNDSTNIDLVAGSERNGNQTLVFKIDPKNGKLEEVSGGIPSRLSDEVYGFCLYRSSTTQKFYAFINDKSGAIEQWELLAVANDSIKGELVRSLKVNTQPEGMVADDKSGLLYVGEEGKGIWVFNAEPTIDAVPKFVSMSGQENAYITYDIEGLAIYRTAQDSLLIASSQGNNTYAVFELNEGYPYLGSFRVQDGNIDGSEETDGIEVSSVNLGGEFQQGVFIAQDGYNYSTSGEIETQNFKIVPWKRIEEVLKKQ